MKTRRGNSNNGGSSSHHRWRDLPRSLLTGPALLLGALVVAAVSSGGSTSTSSSPSDHHQQQLPIHDVALDLNDTHHLFWRVDYQERTIRFEVHSRRRGASHPWVGVGFSDRGEAVGSDYCVLWTDWHGRVRFQNALIDSDGRMVVASHQACRDFRYKVADGVLKFTFSRSFDTCHPGHYLIEGGTTHVLWSWGAGPLYRLGGVRAAGDSNGLVRVQLLKPNLPTNNHHRKECKVIEIRSKHVEVPGEETTYWCTVERLPDDFTKKHHILEFGPAIQPGNEDLVHHMEVFHCEYPPDFEVPRYQGPCHAADRAPEIDACKRVLAAWAMGASPFVYPEEAGLPIGGPDFNPFVMLEVHYNNPGLNKGRVDSSGVAIHYTSRLRKHDAGIIELGLEYTDKMAIPPKAASFTLSGYCVPECTALGLSEEGIYIFGSQLHTHLTGVRAWTKHYRGEDELPELNRDNHYSTHFQEIRRLPKPVHVEPGDALIMSCEFSTADRVNVTVGGFAISDEMCVNYVHYYPKVDLEVCKSSVDTKTLVEYFEFMKRWELQPTSPDLGWRGNYHAIQWTPLRSGVLHDMYFNAPLSMQCNKSSGARFPGYWENIPIPKAFHLLPEPTRRCKKDVVSEENENSLDIDGRETI
ncbi:dopamine beta-hydroxylase-like [Macrobrachium nipponense]|uniref:dopamine beta-hydroxylase-like n=1 Tax=Macrobrachium nipponense TaxID=159736 RepID=UPI0030C8AD9C